MRPDWLILHGGALGDSALTIQLALRLPPADGSSQLHVISRSNPGNLSACRPAITRQSADALGLHWLHASDAGPAPDDVAHLIRGARVLNALAGADSAVHQRLEQLRPGQLVSFDPRPRPGLRRHITAQWLSDLESQGLLVPKCTHQHPQQRSLGVATELRENGGAVLRRAGAAPDVVLIHPGSGGRDKCWLFKNFRAVAELLAKDGQRVCFLIGPVEVEWWPDDALAELTRGYPVLRLPSPDELAAAVAAAHAVVANDSGPAHLAALLGTPTVTIFGPTSPNIWRPLGPGGQVVEGDPERYPGDWGIRPAQVAELLAAVRR